MRRKLIGLICVCLLFSGCRVGSSESLPTESAATESATEATTEAIRLPLLEQGIVSEESGNLRYIPNATVESMTAPEMRLLGNGLLLSRYADNVLVLNHISLEDGAPVKSAAIPCGAGTKLYIGSGEIGLCDRESGAITVLDEGFQIKRTYAVPQEGDAWYLNSELETLFIFYSDRGVLARNLETGDERWLVDNGFRVTTLGSTNGYVIFAYTDRADQKTYTRCLNLSAVTMETLPVDGPVSAGIHQGDTWLLQSRDGEGRYMVIRDESGNAFDWTDSPVRLLASRRHLLAADASGRNLTVYENDGTFLSRCALPQRSDAMAGADFVWSGYWDGYFFTDYFDGVCRLMFWDVKADSDGEDLEMLPLGATQQSQPVLEQQLYERAEQLSQRYGVDICIAEQCSLEYRSYQSYAMTDPVFVRSALDVLEEALEVYPEGFFHQLKFGSIESIRIELVGGITVQEGVDTLPPSAGGFVSEAGSYYLMVLDGFTLLPSTVYHEFSHIIDARLEWDSFIREDALYSEGAWLDLQPEGFRYAMSHKEMPEEVLAFGDSGYFISDYAMTNPTEDRAEVMQAAMENYSWCFEPGSGSREKLQFYADCIRDCFDTTGWPETTAWEQALR